MSRWTLPAAAILPVDPLVPELVEPLSNTLLASHGSPSGGIRATAIAVLSVVIVGCQDIPPSLDAEAQSSKVGAFRGPSADAFVDDDATGANDGTSWADAYPDLQDALADATDMDGDGTISIWIAGGKYLPTDVYSPDGVEGGAYGEEARAGVLPAVPPMRGSTPRFS